MFDEGTRLVTLGGSWKDFMGITALPLILETLDGLDGVASMSKLVMQTGKSESFIRAGLKLGCNGNEENPQRIWRSGKGQSTRYWLHEPTEEEIEATRRRKKVDEPQQEPKKGEQSDLF